MKRVIRAAAWLYPKLWRQRYGDEFEALIEEAGADWRSLADVFLEAIKMRFTHWNFTRLTLVLAVGGAMIAAAVSFAVPNRWESQTVLRLDGADPATSLGRMLIQVESRPALTTVITDHDLYHAERQRMPLEDVIEKMKENIVVRPVSTKTGATTVFAVRFVDEDRHKAQQVTKDLAARLIDLHGARQESDLKSVMEIIDPPSLPLRPTSPNRPLLTGIGLLAGLIVAVVLQVRRRSPGVCPTCGRPITATV